MSSGISPRTNTSSPATRPAPRARIAMSHASGSAWTLQRSSMEPRSLGVVERARHDLGADLAGAELGRERTVVARPDPAEPDRPVEDGAARGRRHATPDRLAVVQRDPSELRAAAIERQPDELPADREPAEALERARSDERLLARVHGPDEPELRRRVVRERVLPDVRMPLLQAQDLERVQPVRRDPERFARLEELLPELRSPRA